ncbi:MAG: NADH-quinone oxidoreductase subunit NuoN [Gammaproteobacteria bacterium]|nr:NADH-quinone oxidoreductase subunit NuoN [Gammaproteobacteria bacterium]MCW8987885.1 NADH-quinone oxidoreductase subunit NuoN [Gammaproteobacteria bacterium]
MTATLLTNLHLATPEIFILSMASIILVVDLFLTENNRYITYLLSQFTLVVAFLLTLNLFSGDTFYIFSQTFVSDPMSSILKLGVYFATFVTFLYSKDYLIQRNIFSGEYFVLGLFAVLGMMIMISASSFLTLYLGLELLSLCLYAMVALQRDSSVASESAMKYFVLGAIASGMLLYGMSMLYGVTGSLDIQIVSQQLGAVTNKTILAFGLVFIIVGVAFKLGAVPFHMWVPDVYQGSPTAVTIFIATAPKIAAFAMLMRLLVGGLLEIHAQWQGILIILAVSSMAIGNIVAIAQTNIKRMLAYSTISHIGFLMLGVLSGTAEGFAASMFYTLTYVLMSMASFGAVIIMSRKGFEADKLDDYKGLNQRSPWLALMMLFIMFSMAGVPPFVGFWAKLSVLKAVVSADLLWLAIVAVVFSIIGAFYYLRIIKLMYFDKAEVSEPIECAIDLRWVFSLNAGLILLIGLMPESLLALCKQVVMS